MRRITEKLVWLAAIAGMITVLSIIALAEFQDSSQANETVLTSDTIPPASITNLKVKTYTSSYINWTWRDPPTADFAKVMVYINGKFKANITKGKQYYNATNISQDTLYTISMHTVDTSGNINKTWVNNTAKTATVYEEKAYSHLYEQMDKYKTGNTPRLIQSYVPTSTYNPYPGIYNAHVYDNDLAMLAFLIRGTPEDMRRAKVIREALLWAQNHDQDFNDGRLRDAYWSTDIKAPDGIHSSIIIPDSSTGNMAWTIIAWTTDYEKTGNKTSLNAAKRIGDWIYANTYDTRGAGGYTGGYAGWVPQKVYWKSTEHNEDVYVAFLKLYKITGNITWLNRSLHAKKFLQAMWNQSEGHFWAGTTEDGLTINKKLIPLDVNTWGMLTLGTKYNKSIGWIEKKFKITHHNFTGFDFNDDKDGVWFEGTAQASVMYQVNKSAAKSDYYKKELSRAQVLANNNNGKGIIAACHDGLTTGLEWTYPNALHIGAISWFIFAERSYNPYWNIRTSDRIPYT